MVDFFFQLQWMNTDQWEQTLQSQNTPKVLNSILYCRMKMGMTLVIIILYIVVITWGNVSIHKVHRDEQEYIIRVNKLLDRVDIFVNGTILFPIGYKM